MMEPKRYNSRLKFSIATGKFLQTETRNFLLPTIYYDTVIINLIWMFDLKTMHIFSINFKIDNDDCIF